MWWVEREGGGVGTGEVVEIGMSGFRMAKECDWERERVQVGMKDVGGRDTEEM